MNTDVQTTRKCKGCDSVKDMEMFYRNTTCPGGRTSKCKDCINAYNLKRNMTTYRGRRLENMKRYKQRGRDAVLKQYGSRCACCAEDTLEFLELDNIKGGGNIHRKSEKRDLYRVVKEQGFPKDEYRLLCSNCNHSMGVRGYCPHKV